MKATLILMAIASTTILAAAQQGGGAVGTPGVMDDTCWKGGTHHISVDVRGTIHGDDKVTVTEGTDTASGTGTPDPDGGTAESSEIKVGSETYKVDGGKMQRKNDNGAWVDMSKETCPEPLMFGAEETIGSLPYFMSQSMRVMRHEDELFSSLPA